jgi:hypothetical protein
MSVLLGICIAVIAGCVGHIIGTRTEADYWADHDDGSAVHHRGVFYHVTREGAPKCPLT